MKKLSKIKLTNLSQEDLADREMNALRGGHNCDLHSPEGNVICTWVGGAGSDISVYGGSKAPGMP